MDAGVSDWSASELLHLFREQDSRKGIALAQGIVFYLFMFLFI